MYLIDRILNRIQKLEQKSFGELGLRERQHLQEWLAYNPEALGEELLIIQKEFDKFSDTNERLDLLALDKSGNIVVIENKLDDTGRDVTWQVQKYASYCATLTKEQIRSIYQQYLDRQGLNEEAESNLADFFNLEYDEITLNQRQTQRIMMVAANFRKEVTSTVLWLLDFNIRIQCFKTTPFVLGDQLFLTLEQIIPTKDTEEFVISMAQKTKEEITTQEGLKSRHHIRMEFWNKLLPLLKGKTPIFQSTSATKDHWVSSGGTGISGLVYSFTVTKSYAGVSLTFAKSNKDENKLLYDELIKYRDSIEREFGRTLKWERLDDKISSRVGFYVSGVSIFNREDWDKMLDFLPTDMIKLERAMRKPLVGIKRNTKITDDSQVDLIPAINDNDTTVIAPPVQSPN
ncbi:DUF4268 domain-containing protein [Pontibacter mangrovi]|uniref:DUF4268 domain-containing protein n=1 Tax=Pontibacter mangrovi TaxID=2589816 RepID=A0A501WDM1_9BACT|nr:DUF4268 domain-containing protein [Pontibacter mangrovi]TPE43606.1 DUF4268 domain-containing protein [Pontibacter mangrovi]